MLLLVCFSYCCHASSKWPVRYLPGFNGPLPFHMETGYVGVGESDEDQLFYYFVKSETNPREDPLIMWLTGGPGCSGWIGLNEVGPLTMEYKEFNGSIPGLLLNPNSWTKIASIIFVDSPVRTGFSYSKGYKKSGDFKASKELYQFLRKDYWYLLSYYYMNYYDTVRRALHIRKGTVGEWVWCNSEHYVREINSTIEYHLNLTNEGYRALIYSGDHDLVVPFVGTETWIRSLNSSIVDEWRSWFVGGQIAGYTRAYVNNLTFATVKGAGHTPPSYKPENCFAMFERWLHGKPL
ncbi:hypothetical protein AAC387_Pa05g2622 [Persea americana]